MSRGIDPETKTNPCIDVLSAGFLCLLSQLNTGVQDKPGSHFFSNVDINSALDLKAGHESYPCLGSLLFRRLLFEASSGKGFGWFSLVKINQGRGRFFTPTAESVGVSARIGSGAVRGGPEVRFHEGSTRVPPGSARAAG